MEWRINSLFGERRGRKQFCCAVLELRVQALGSGVLREGKGEDSWALEKAPFWKRRDLSRVLSYRYRLGKEVSLRKKRVPRL